MVVTGPVSEDGLQKCSLSNSCARNGIQRIFPYPVYAPSLKIPRGMGFQIFLMFSFILSHSLEILVVPWLTW